MKINITLAEYNELADAIKALYKEIPGENDAESTYRLDLTDYEDPDELRRARDREREEAKAARRRAEEAETKLAEQNRGKAREDKDIDTLEASWRTENQKIKDAAAADVAKMRTQIDRQLRQSTAREIAARISTVPDAMYRLLLDRLSVEYVDDEPKLRVLDDAGAKSALTVAQLEKEYVDNPRYAGIIIGSKANGSGAAGLNGGGAPGKALAECSEAEKVAWHAKDPAGYMAAVAAQNARR